MPTYFPTSTASDLSPSWPFTTEFDLELDDVEEAGFHDETIALDADGDKSAGYILESGSPNSDDWEDGGTWRAEFYIKNNEGNMNVRARCRAVRLTSSGGIDQSGSYTSYQTLTDDNTLYTFNPAAPTWSTSEACSHRLAFEWHFNNLDSMMTNTMIISFVQSFQDVDYLTDITENAGGCAAPFTPKCMVF